MAKYMTPDFDVTVYEIKERIALDLDIGSGDSDGLDDLSWNLDTDPNGN